MRWKSPYTWAVLLLGGSTWFAARVRVSHVARSVPVPLPVHMGVHILLFAVLTILALFAAVSWPWRGMLVLLILLFGYGTEYYEHLKDGYPVEQPDVITDSMGVALGTLTGMGLLAARRRDAADDGA